MGILRTDIISHSQLEGSGSVEFDGDGDSLTFTTTSALSLDSDFTIEFYIFNNTIALDTQHPSPVTMPAESGHNSQIYTNSSNNYYGLYKQADIVTTGNNSALTGVWQHVAFTRKGSICFAFLDGVLKNTAVSTVTFGGTSGTYRLGSYTGSGGDVNGFISNLRIIKGTAIYTANFTVPKFELKNIAGTTLLGCQSTSSATDFAVTPNTVSVAGGGAASSFHPGLKKDITDTGVIFDGVTNFDSLAYFTPPSGKTTQRNRGRGIIPGGRVSGSASGINNISFIEIQSQGIGEEFGDLTESVVIGSSFASSTRAVRGGGYVSPNDSGVYDFVTIASTGNAQDFGDLLDARHWAQGGGNQTRGILAGGNGGGNVIEFVTIASTGNGSDFGDLINSYTTTVGSGNGAASPTRLLFAGGTLTPSPSTTNIIQFVTIASTGNATDFGDLTDNKTRFGTCSSGIRGLYGGGGPTENDKTNTIVFVTLASTGNTTDFGDRTVVSNNVAATSNASRGVFIGGQGPSGPTAAGNFIDFVTITSTGNATDFGDNVTNIEHASACSDSHGGLE